MKTNSMKKFLLISFVFISSITTAQGVQYGLKGGLNFGNTQFEISSFSVNGLIDTDIRPSLYLGGFVEFISNSNQNRFHTGLIYRGNGFKFDANNENFIFKISQLNVPLLFKYSVIDGFFINAGGYFGAIIDVQGEIEFRDQNTGELINESSDISNEFETLDAGLSIGVEYAVGDGFFIEAQYSYGLINILNEEEVIFPEASGLNASVKNRVLTAGIGYKF